MKPNRRQFILGAIFIGVGIYNIVIHEYLESSLYIMAGLSFVLNQLTNEPGLAMYKKQLVIATWTFIIITSILFLFLLQYRYL